MTVDADNDNTAADRVFLRQRKIRFADLGEVFLARLLLSLVTDPLEERTVTVSLDLACVFPSLTIGDVLTRTSDLEFTYPDRLTEDMVDFMNDALGIRVKAREITTTVLVPKLFWAAAQSDFNSTSRSIEVTAASLLSAH